MISEVEEKESGGPSRFRHARAVRSAWLVTAALGVLVILGCGRDENPLGGGPQGAVELAGSPEQCDAAPAPIPALIDAQFNGGQRNTVRARCANILRKSSKQPANAFKMALQLADFIDKHSKGSAAQQAELISAFLCVSQNEAPGGSCEFAIPDGAEVNVVGPGGGGPFFVDDGKIGYLLQPGWSKTTRIIFTVPGDCTLDTLRDQYPECASHGTIPDGPFETPASGILAHCAVLPDGVDPENARLARNIDAFNDPNAIDEPPVEENGIEYFPSFDPPFGLPGCAESEISDRVAAPRPAGGADGVSPAGKRGSSGARLAVTRKTQGGQISAFSEWGIVDIASTSAEITGRVGQDCGEGGCVDPIEGAAVDLFCDDGIGEETPAGPTIVTGEDGVFSFSTAGYDFASGSTCLVTASAEGFFSGSSGSFEVTPGTNDVGDILLDPADY